MVFFGHPAEERGIIQYIQLQLDPDFGQIGHHHSGDVQSGLVATGDLGLEGKTIRVAGLDQELFGLFRIISV